MQFRLTNRVCRSGQNIATNGANRQSSPPRDRTQPAWQASASTDEESAKHTPPADIVHGPRNAQHRFLHEDRNVSLPETKIFVPNQHIGDDSGISIDLSGVFWSAERWPTSSIFAPRKTRPVKYWRKGKILGDYRIIRRIGRGGMGIVYQACDVRTGELVAIKAMRDDLADDIDAVARFLSEAEIGLRIDHPNIVRTLDVGRSDRTFYQIAELVRGGTLDAQIRRRASLPWREATGLAIQVCQGLAAAHKLGVIHRDIKPENLVLDRDGTIKLADFGLAKFREARHQTAHGQVLGTVHFMSPEQCNAELVDARSDIYSMGATYYTMLCGRRPYASSGSSMQVMFAHCHHSPPDPCQVSSRVPPPCAGVIRRAMAKDPADRFQTADDLRAALAALLASDAARH